MREQKRYIRPALRGENTYRTVTGSKKYDTQVVRALNRGARTLVHVTEHAEEEADPSVSEIPASELWYELCKLEEERATLRRTVRDLQDSRHLSPRREQRGLELRLLDTRERRCWVEARLKVLEDEHRRRRELSRTEKHHEPN